MKKKKMFYSARKQVKQKQKIENVDFLNSQKSSDFTIYFFLVAHHLFNNMKSVTCQTLLLAVMLLTHHNLAHLISIFFLQTTEKGEHRHKVRL